MAWYASLHSQANSVELRPTFLRIEGARVILAKEVEEILMQDKEAFKQFQTLFPSKNNYVTLQDLLRNAMLNPGDSLEVAVAASIFCRAFIGRALKKKLDYVIGSCLCEHDVA